MRKWNWNIHLTERQYIKLIEGLKSRYRFQLRLAVETIGYKAGILTVNIPVGKPDSDIQDRISDYINGFAQAIS